jgi:hypothetical protein
VGLSQLPVLAAGGPGGCRSRPSVAIELQPAVITLALVMLLVLERRLGNRSPVRLRARLSTPRINCLANITLPRTHQMTAIIAMKMYR